MTINKTAAARSVARMSEREKDRIAAMVLALVLELTQHPTGSVQGQAAPETTSTGYLDPTVRDYVMKRSA